MALVRTFIQITPREAIVKWVGQGTDTLALADLVLPGRQALSSTATPGVGITGVLSSVAADGACIVSRGGVEAIHVHGGFEFQTDAVATAVIDENAGTPVVVTLDNSGTLILKLRKLSGFTDVQFNEALLG